MNKYICLIDCDNFYTSCEQIFHPALRNKPVVVAGGKNGIVVARSKEAKAVGIPMGGATFEYRSLFTKEDVIVRTPNHTLYGDIAKRIRKTIDTFCLPTFIYSIDEVFLEIPEQSFSTTLLEAIQTKIKRWTGIDVSIGVSSTKTLAKVATKIAKKGKTRRKVLLDQEEINKTLSHFPIEDIWGVGRKSVKKLHLQKIKWAKDFLRAPDLFLKKLMGIHGFRIKKELLGENAYPFVEKVKDKSLQITRTFPTEIVSIKKIKEILSSFIEEGCEKLRKIDRKAEGFSLFLETSRFKAGGAFTKTFTLAEPSNYTPDFLQLKEEALCRLVDGDLFIKRAGIHFFCLVEATSSQQGLFTEKKESPALMKTLDAINEKYGKKTLRFAASTKRYSKESPSSKNYTTSWDQLLEIPI
ncbi:DUF4113 domain-containing protein [bacterium]|nr:DUF4113 domain-containing protein [bacterium]